MEKNKTTARPGEIWVCWEQRTILTKNKDRDIGAWRWTLAMSGAARGET